MNIDNGSENDRQKVSDCFSRVTNKKGLSSLIYSSKLNEMRFCIRENGRYIKGSTQIGDLSANIV